MNTIKFALLGTAAIAAVSVSAQASTASDVAALRAQVEALSAQVAAAQTTADLPAGYQFVTTSMEPSATDPSRKVYTISIRPSADAPATASFYVKGYVRAGFIYSQTTYSNGLDGGAVVPAATLALRNVPGDFGIKARGHLDIGGKTETSVGDVGVDIGLEANYDGNSGSSPVAMTQAKGWWAMTPNLTLIAGFDGFVGGTGGYGTDKMNAFYSGGALGNRGGLGDTSQFALAYADGPMSFKVAVGHYEGKYNNYGNLSPLLTGTNDLSDTELATNAISYDDMAFGAAGEYKGDSLSAKVAGYVHGNDYQIGLGLTAAMDMFTVSVAGDIGKDANHTFTTVEIAGPGANGSEVQDATYWDASAFAGASLSDSIKAEIGVGYSAFNGAANAATPTVVATSTNLAVAGGIYYSPVSQLTIGAEAAWNRANVSTTIAGAADDSLDAQTLTADLVTVFKF